MAKIKWDQAGEHYYETGVKNAVLYLTDRDKESPTYGEYIEGYGWNGVSKISESPSGAEETAIYADDRKYLSLRSTEDFAGTIDAYTYPDEFAECDGSKDIAPGIAATQQKRRMFGLSYRTILGNDLDGDEYGYKLHLVYGATASPAAKDHSTVNESPEAVTMSWEFKTVPVEIGEGFKPSAKFTIDSTKIDPDKLKKIERILYGIDATAFDTTKTYAVGDYVTYETKTYVCKTAVTTPGAWDSSKWEEVTEVPGPRLPMPKEIIELMA